jgi:hypothetical protein
MCLRYVTVPEDRHTCLPLCVFMLLSDRVELALVQVYILASQHLSPSTKPLQSCVPPSCTGEGMVDSHPLPPTHAAGSRSVNSRYQDLAAFASCVGAGRSSRCVGCAGSSSRTATRLVACGVCVPMVVGSGGWCMVAASDMYRACCIAGIGACGWCCNVCWCGYTGS